MGGDQGAALEGLEAVQVGGRVHAGGGGLGGGRPEGQGRVGAWGGVADQAGPVGQGAVQGPGVQGLAPLAGDVERPGGQVRVLPRLLDLPCPGHGGDGPGVHGTEHGRGLQAQGVGDLGRRPEAGVQLGAGQGPVQAPDRWRGVQVQALGGHGRVGGVGVGAQVLGAGVGQELGGHGPGVVVVGEPGPGPGLLLAGGGAGLLGGGVPAGPGPVAGVLVRGRLPVRGLDVGPGVVGRVQGGQVARAGGGPGGRWGLVALDRGRRGRGGGHGGLRGGQVDAPASAGLVLAGPGGGCRGGVGVGEAGGRGVGGGGLLGRGPGPPPGVQGRLVERGGGASLGLQGLGQACGPGLVAACGPGQVLLGAAGQEGGGLEAGPPGPGHLLGGRGHDVLGGLLGHGATSSPCSASTVRGGPGPACSRWPGPRRGRRAGPSGRRRSRSGGPGRPVPVRWRSPWPSW